MIKLPKKIKIGAHQWDIRFPVNCGKEASAENYETLEICVDGKDRYGIKKSDSIILQNFIHELFHIIDQFTGHLVFEKDDEHDNEGAIDAYSEAVLMIVNDNLENIFRSMVDSGFPLKDMVERIYSELVTCV